jgi:hypothetical protein
VGKFLKFGCFGLVAIVALFVVAAIALPKPPPPQQTVSGQPGAPASTSNATVGQTASLGGWEVTLLDFGPYERFDQKVPATKAQGKLVVADLRVKNTQNSQRPTSRRTTSS